MCPPPTQVLFLQPVTGTQEHTLTSVPNQTIFSLSLLLSLSPPHTLAFILLHFFHLVFYIICHCGGDGRFRRRRGHHHHNLICICPLFPLLFYPFLVMKRFVVVVKTRIFLGTFLGANKQADFFFQARHHVVLSAYGESAFFQLNSSSCKLKRRGRSRQNL